MANIHIYNGTVTAGGTDGTEISYEGALTNPISFTLDAATAESKTQAIAIRCDSGFSTSGNTVVSFTGTNADKWSVSATENGTYASTLTIMTAIGATNTVIYVKADSAATETPTNDTSVKISVAATIVATS